MPKLTRAATQAELRRVLECPTWPEGIEASVRYSRVHDDHDGTGEGEIVVVIGHDGDCWVDINGKRPCQTLRYRTGLGGGASLRTRNALLLLAYAMKLDAEERKHGRNA